MHIAYADKRGAAEKVGCRSDLCHGDIVLDDTTKVNCANCIRWFGTDFLKKLDWIDGSA